MYDRSTIYPTILERMRGGESLRKICLDDGMPHIDTVMEWLKDDPAFSEQYTRAGDVRGDYYFDKAIDAVGEVPPMVGDTNHKAKGNADTDQPTRMDSAYVAWQRVRADIYLKVAAQCAPKKYGVSKVDMTHAAPDGGPIRTDNKVTVEYVSATAGGVPLPASTTS